MTIEETDAAVEAKLTRIAHASDATGLLRLRCPGTGFQVEVEVTATNLTVVVCKWDNGDDILWDGPCADPATTLVSLRNAIEMRDISIETLTCTD